MKALRFPLGQFCAGLVLSLLAVAGQALRAQTAQAVPVPQTVQTAQAAQGVQTAQAAQGVQNAQAVTVGQAAQNAPTTTDTVSAGTSAASPADPVEGPREGPPASVGASATDGPSRESLQKSLRRKERELATLRAELDGLRAAGGAVVDAAGAPGVGADAGVVLDSKPAKPKPPSATSLFSRTPLLLWIAAALAFVGALWLLFQRRERAPSKPMPLGRTDVGVALVGRPEATKPAETIKPPEPIKSAEAIKPAEAVAAPRGTPLARALPSGLPDLSSFRGLGGRSVSDGQ